ncbi:hypothetical protein [Nocardia sp. NBC_01377]|uniref:hypothetical protein n=1 Tax=Nocardia sp. NBC_01377 TaxID=2903595 RepID=UPI0038706CCE
MRKLDRKPSSTELAAFVFALLVGFGVAAFWGSLVSGIAVAIAVVIGGFAFFYTRKA